MPPGWVTHKLENNISQKFSHTSGSIEPLKRLPAEGSGIGRTISQSTRLGRSVGFERRSAIGPGETETPLLKGHTRYTGPQEKSSDHGSLDRHVLALEGLLVAGSGGPLCLFPGTRTQLVEIPGSIYLCELWPRADILLGSLTLFGDLAPPTACRLQFWENSGQTTNAVGTQPHP